jgi:hypothetical protein
MSLDRLDWFDDGALLVVGRRKPAEGPSDIVIFRVDPTGELDRTFGSEGRLRINTATSDGAFAGMVLSSGRIALAGHRGMDPLVMVRNADGTPTSTFADDGTWVGDFAEGSGRAFGIAQDGRDRLLVSGYSDDGAGWDGFVVRFNPVP